MKLPIGVIKNFILESSSEYIIIEGDIKLSAIKTDFINENQIILYYVFIYIFRLLNEHHILKIQ